MKAKILLSFFITVLLFAATSANAASYNDGDACSNPGAWHQNSNAIGVYYLMCSSGSWESTIYFSSNGTLTALGRNSGANWTGPGNMLAIGEGAGENVTDGYGHIFLGASAGVNVSGQHNMGIGNLTLMNSDGQYNTAIGNDAGQNLISGDGNVILGYSAGRASNWSGSSNILIGYDVEAPSGATANNEMNIGNVLYGSGMYNTTGFIGINDSTPDAALDVVGDINYTGVLVDVSDIRAKENISPLRDPLRKLSKINGFSFTMKNDPRHSVELGVSAQDVQTAFPELVTKVDSDGTLGVNYQGLIPPMIEAIKILDAENKTLKIENSDLRKSIHELNRRVDVLEGSIRPPLTRYNQ